jgi:hypothetical protein
MAISYTPQFSHKDWIDFVDSVQAGGTNGINIRFHGIEAEFATISSVIAQIAQIAQVPAPVTVGFAPLMLPTNPDAPNSGWSQISWVGGIPHAKVPDANSGGKADGVLPLTLPEGATILNLTVLAFGFPTTTLVQALRVSPFTVAQLVSVSGGGSSAVPNGPVFTSGTHQYYLQATTVNEGDVLNGFTITYLPAS